MPLFVRFIKKTVIGGIFFLVPIGAIIFVVGNVVSFMHPIAAQIAGILGPAELGPFLMVAIIVLALVAVSFVSGLLASSIVGHNVFDWLERMVLNRVPGYSIVKNAADSAAMSLGQIKASGPAKAVYLRSGEGWQIGFVMEKIDEDICAILTPDAPTPTSGPLILVASDQFVESDLTVNEAMGFLMRLGVGGIPGKHLPDALKTIAGLETVTR
jgi:uncharacterized membrane protein